MTENEVAIELVEWAREVIPDLNAGEHYLTAQKLELPDVTADVAEKRIDWGDVQLFPHAAIQQIMLRVFEAELVFLVETESGGTADQDETEQLRSFGAALEASLLQDATLGSRVVMASPICTFDYRLPFIEYADGTRGRQMTLTMVVAEPVQPEH